MSNTKILAVDLDDTLFDDKKGICRQNIDAINDMLDAGHVLAIDTGRPTHVIKNLLKQFDFFHRENVYLLGYQGTIGTRPDGEKALFGQYLDNDISFKIINAAQAEGLTVIVFEFGTIYAFCQDKNVRGYAKVAKENVTIIKSTKELEGHQLSKFMVVDFDCHERLLKFQSKYKDEFENQLVSMFSHPAFLEFVGKDTGKGTGLTKLANLLNIPMENTVACGDQENDISMIKAAGVGVAVANGQDQVKASADYITTVDNNNGAVAEAIRKFIL